MGLAFVWEILGISEHYEIRGDAWSLLNRISVVWTVVESVTIFVVSRSCSLMFLRFLDFNGMLRISLLSELKGKQLWIVDLMGN